MIKRCATCGQALPSSVGNAIRRAREARGWTQADLGAHLASPVTRQRIAGIETDPERVSIGVIRAIADALAISLATLFEGEATG